MTIINLTPHIIKIVNERNRVVRRYGAAKIPARLVEYRRVVRFPNGKCFYKVTIGNTIINLPDSKPGVYYIVSTTLQKNAKDRFDLYSPIDIVFNKKNGKILGCRGLSLKK